ncbi:MAG: phosphoribosylglycinamide formyltransferase [Burkholderiaceae bacterium]
MKKIVILISGRGSNMEAIISTCRAEGWPAEVACVIANKASAPGLVYASAAGIPTVAIESKDYTTREQFEDALAAAIDAHRPDCVVLAGFMRVLSETFVHRYADRMLNVHPSLLPAFAGLDTHGRALAAGVRAHGATVHFVSPVVDAGPIVARAVVPVRPDDTADALAARVLAAEHRLLPKAVEWFLSGRAVMADGRVTLADAVASQALMVCP